MLAGLPALIGCFSADFIAYDDSAHIANPAYAHAASAWDYFKPQPDTSYIPLTLLSYKVDRFLHGAWTERKFQSWAPGVRLDTLLLHACAALILWRLLTRLKFSEACAFFIALIFACHPLACETLCWVSERKNAFAALFGFAAMYMLSLDRGARSTRWNWARWPAACLFFALALLGKPSALGLLPIMLLLEAVQTIPSVRARFFKSQPQSSAPQNSHVFSAPSVFGALALAGLAFAFMRLNLFTHAREIIPPPGGSVFTALLTDLEIVSRYLFNLVLPFKLSAVYEVLPIVSLGDPRAWLYGGILSAVLLGTLLVARNRWRAIFGWCWFFSALAPNANLISIVHVMADRYLYLSTPGFLIVMAETFAGLRERFFTTAAPPGNSFRLRPMHFAAALFALSCAFLSVARGSVWRSSFELFSDAATRQPHAFYAHYGLGGAYDTLYHNTPTNSAAIKTYEEASIREFKTALDDCPDSERYFFKSDAALLVGEHFFKLGDAANAEKYLAIGARPLATSMKEQTRALCLAYLSVIDLSRKNAPLALDKARASLALSPTDSGRIAFAKAALALAAAESDPAARRARLDAAQAQLLAVPANSNFKMEANELLAERRR